MVHVVYANTYEDTPINTSRGDHVSATAEDR